MKRIDKIIVTALLAVIIPAAFVSAQDKKSEQRIKIIVADDGGSKVLIDTLITGSPKDSIIMKGGKTIYLTRAEKDDSDAVGGSKQYIVTTTVSDGNDKGKEVTKEVHIISSDTDTPPDHNNGKCKQAHCEELVNGGKYSYTVVSDEKDSGSDMAKYVISRDGLRITVEGGDYDKVKEIIKDIEKSLGEQPDQKK